MSDFDGKVLSHIRSIQASLEAMPFAPAAALGVACMECLWTVCARALESRADQGVAWTVFRKGLDSAWDWLILGHSANLSQHTEMALFLSSSDQLDRMERTADVLLFRSAGAFAGMLEAVDKRDATSISPALETNIDMIDLLLEDIDPGDEAARKLLEAEMERERRWLERLLREPNSGTYEALKREAANEKLFGELWFVN